MTQWWRRAWQALVVPGTQLPYPAVNQGWGRPFTFREQAKSVSRYLHKRLLLALTGQSRLIRRRAKPGGRVLMCYFGADNIGDALTDFSGRRLLLGTGWKVDLLIDPVLASLFEQDEVFERVFTDPSAVDPGAYDLAVLNNYNLRTLHSKRRLFPKLPFCSVVGFFYGIDYNHTQLSYFAVNDIFGLGRSDADLLETAAPFLSNSDSRFQVAVHAWHARDDGRPVIAVAVGGRETYRTYAHWPEVFRCLDRSNEPWSGYRFVLVGSDNGLGDARAICSHQYEHIAVESLVGKTNLIECRAILAHAAFFLGPDGGLMHLAHTTGVPTLPLFSSLVPPHMQLTPACGSHPIYSKGVVSEIKPKEVIDALRGLIPLRSRRPALAASAN